MHWHSVRQEDYKRKLYNHILHQFNDDLYLKLLEQLVSKSDSPNKFVVFLPRYLNYRSVNMQEGKLGYEWSTMSGGRRGEGPGSVQGRRSYNSCGLPFSADQPEEKNKQYLRLLQNRV